MSEKNNMPEKDELKETLKNIAIHEAKSLFYKGKLLAVLGKKAAVIAQKTTKKVSEKIKK